MMHAIENDWLNRLLNRLRKKKRISKLTYRNAACARLEELKQRAKR